jgi:eukaryotic-like serine/threonine-protein kinase
VPAVSTSDLLERVRRLLQPRYQVERELGAESSAVLFLAHDTALKRTVAVKVLVPEIQGDVLARRFLREARILARLTHPNIVAIHESEEKDGLVYYVRDFLEGEPLSARLERGRLPEGEAVHLAQDLLAALGVAHRSGVTHRDLRPAHVFCLPDRAVLVDFGLATSTIDTAASVDAGRAADPSYSAPEQSAGGEATARSDLYSVGAILYHALTGRRWVAGTPPAKARWRGVPHRLRVALRRALAVVPAERWSDAASFERGLEDVDAPERRTHPIVYGSALLVGIVGLLVWTWPKPTRLIPPAKELAVAPFEVERGPEREGADLAHLVQLNLRGLPGLSLTPARHVLQWWTDHGRTLVGIDKARAAGELRVHWLAHGTLEHRSDSLIARVTLYDAAGRKDPIPELRFGAGDLGPLSDSLAVLIVRAIAPQLAGSYRVMSELAGVRLASLRQFLRGEAAFQQDEWAAAEHSYEAALNLDSSFALAAWRLANVKRWRRVPYGDDLRSLYERQDARLRPMDRALISALNEPDLASRLSKLDSVIARFPDDAYTRLLCGDELFHRGPLVGRGVEEGNRAMAEAIARDSSLALAYDHLIFSAIRAGERDRAREMIRYRRRISDQSSPGDPDLLALVQLAYDGRFLPWRAEMKHRYLTAVAGSGQIEGIVRLFRIAVSWFDIPESQVELSDLLLRSGPSDSAARASAHQGKAIGLMTLGRPTAALAALDSAAALFDNGQARLEQAEWRIMLPALGLPLPGDTREWKARLAGLSSDEVLGRRAAWALAFAAFASGDTLEGQRWRDQLRKGGGPASELERFAGAMMSVARGRWPAALAASDSLRMSMNAAHPPDPFARAAFHLERSRWFSAVGDTAAAERELLWYENSDVDGWPAGVSQAGELDGMLGVYARLERARLLLRAGASSDERGTGCALVGRVTELWSKAEPVLRALVSRADSLAKRCGR